MLPIIHTKSQLPRPLVNEGHNLDLIGEEAQKTDGEPEKKHPLNESGSFKGLPAALQKGNYFSQTVYVGCNELQQTETLHYLMLTPSSIPQERRVHLGFSIWFNFDLISITKPAYTIICDYDTKAIDIFEAIGKGLVHCEDRVSFAEYFTKFLSDNSNHLFSLEPTEVHKIFNVRNELERSDSWLYKEERFQFVRELHLKGHTLFLNLDITDEEGVFNQIQHWMEENRLILDTLYASNIIEWLHTDHKKQVYLKNLKMVSSDKTRFIQAYKPQDKKGEPVQFIGFGIDSIKIPEVKSYKSDYKGRGANLRISKVLI